jgi:magnesium-transporting ATPase (P-type)
MAVSFGIRSWIEGGVVAAVIILNIVIGFFQEYSAEKTMNSLRSLGSPTATVVRDGEAMVIPSGEVVPGDLIEVKMGDTIPADIRNVILGGVGAALHRFCLFLGRTLTGKIG